MKKTLSFLVIHALFVCFLFAQPTKRDAASAKPADMSNLTIVSLNDVCDSLVWPEPIGQTITFYNQPNNLGYVTGTNSYGDLAKGNYFDLSTSTSNFVTRALVGLGPVNGANGGNLSKVVNIKVLDGTTGTPGAVLGTYPSTLSEMKLAQNKFTAFTFSPAIPLPASKKIFLILEFPTLTWNTSSDATTKDTLTLLSTAYMQVANPLAWEQYADLSWHDIEDAWGNININIHMYPLVSSVAVNCNPLPVSFGSFNANLKENAIDLNWQTLTEMNNDRFVVEKSNDALKFSAVGTILTKAINGNHQGVLNYQLTDAFPFQGINFYRIRQVDKDGSSEFSKTIKINYTGLVNNDIITHYFPNPAKQRLIIQLGAGISEIESIRFSDVSGKIIRTERPAVAPGGIINISTNGLRSGLNFATIVLPDGKQKTIKVIKE